MAARSSYREILFTRWTRRKGCLPDQVRGKNGYQNGPGRKVSRQIEPGRKKVCQNIDVILPVDYNIKSKKKNNKNKKAKKVVSCTWNCTKNAQVETEGNCEFKEGSRLLRQLKCCGLQEY